MTWEEEVFFGINGITSQISKIYLLVLKDL